jgi:acetoin utilization deacetylase AcuC-like enzyme
VPQAFCAVRPPGHHATADTAMGFCLLNGIAIGAAHALHAHRLTRVAVVDFDVHHGNGTEAIFAAEPRVAYLSSHQNPLYPGTGLEGDVGVGNVVNAPLPPRSGSAVFRDAWRARLLPALEAFRPQLVLVSAGFDGHHLDPLADLDLGAEDYRWLSAELADLASRHCGGKLVSVLEGGYSLTALRECSVAHLRGLTAA